MFILPGLIALVIFIYARPLDFVSALRDLPLLYVFFFLAVFGFLVNLSQGQSKVNSKSQLRWVIVFYAWCFFTAGIKDFGSLSTSGLRLTIAISIYFLIALGLSSFKAFEILSATILACTLWISVVCVHQGMQPFQCIAFLPTESEESPGHPDGRACERPDACRLDAPEPEADYRCEHVGVFGITSVGNGRVRYIGVLQDPNEAAMTVAIGIPLAFAFFQRKRTAVRFAVAATAFLLATITVVMSQSRGGQLVFLGVLGVYFFRRYRWKGLLIATILMLPVLLMGGREGEEADSSAVERLDNLMVGLQLFAHSPAIGVGMGRFTEYHNLTAHNSYVLAAAELGIPGMVAWLSILFASFKVSYSSLTLLPAPEGEVARIWGLSMFSALTGLSVGIFFLSFNYHFIFWIYMGMTAALAGAVARSFPQFHVDVTRKEVGLLTISGLLLLVLVWVYVKYKLGRA